jgi:hypothetical protein
MPAVVTRRMMPPWELFKAHLRRASRPHLERLAAWLGMRDAPAWSDRALVRRVRRVTRRDQRPRRVIQERHLREARPEDLRRLADYLGISAAGWSPESIVQLTWEKVDARAGQDNVGPEEQDDG